MRLIDSQKMFPSLGIFGQLLEKEGSAFFAVADCISPANPGVIDTDGRHIFGTGILMTRAKYSVSQ